MARHSPARAPSPWTCPSTLPQTALARLHRAWLHSPVRIIPVAKRSGWAPRQPVVTIRPLVGGQAPGAMGPTCNLDCQAPGGAVPMHDPSPTRGAFEILRVSPLGPTRRPAVKNHFEPQIVQIVHPSRPSSRCAAFLKSFSGRDLSPTTPKSPILSRKQAQIALPRSARICNDLQGSATICNHLSPPSAATIPHQSPRHGTPMSSPIRETGRANIRDIRVPNASPQPTAAPWRATPHPSPVTRHPSPVTPSPTTFSPPAPRSPAGCQPVTPSPCHPFRL
jgi:hypothetical protein